MSIGSTLLFRGRASAHGAMGHRIDPSFLVSASPPDYCVTGRGMCCSDGAYKRSKVAANQKELSM